MKKTSLILMLMMGLLTNQTAQAGLYEAVGQATKDIKNGEGAFLAYLGAFGGHFDKSNENTRMYCRNNKGKINKDKCSVNKYGILEADRDLGVLGLVDTITGYDGPPTERFSAQTEYLRKARYMQQLEESPAERKARLAPARARELKKTDVMYVWGVQQRIKKEDAEFAAQKQELAAAGWCRTE